MEEIADVELQAERTLTFPAEDGSLLEVDAYCSDKAGENAYTVLFLHGGGFMVGDRRKPKYLPFFTRLLDAGYHVLSLDYRLGMKGKKGIRNVYRAIGMAVEDVASLLRLLTFENPLPYVSAVRVVLCGTSAGAITALQTDYEISNGFSRAALFPKDFKPAAVIALAGAVFSVHGRVRYRCQPPSPTMFFHGTSDRVVVYSKYHFLRWGFFGTASLLRCFRKAKYPFYAVRYEGRGHEIGGRYTDDFDKIHWFLGRMVESGIYYQRDEWINDPQIEANFLTGLDAKQMYKEMEKEK